MRTDEIRALGQQLAELGAILLNLADELDSLARLPESGWIPEAGTPAGAVRRAHYVGNHPLPCGLVFIALCGTACFPFYGRDRAGKIARHPCCEKCLLHAC
ncbi:hypothetical protein [Amycolatopsis anabasis]|uniref:hypothetical protein n=1 Tax=Amycolatopsis anabasis TaxID=1840409 RepID=UPI00131BB4AE|nr:hypothetical protein [Amycolatopsis anabasis]